MAKCSSEQSSVPCQAALLEPGASFLSGLYAEYTRWLAFK